VDWVGVQREIEVGLQRRLRRELQVEPLIICLVQPAPAGTPAYKGRSDAEPDTRPAPRARREAGRPAPSAPEGNQAPIQRPLVGAAIPAAAASTASAPAEPAEPAGRIRRRRSAAVAG
jgi:ribonuclease J